MLVLLLFLGDFPSEGKIKDEGLTTLFTSVLEFDPYQYHGGWCQFWFQICPNLYLPVSTQVGVKIAIYPP